MATAARESDYITEVREANRKAWEAIHKLLSLQSEWNAQDYASTLTTFEGENEGLTAAQVGSVVFDTANALKVVLNAGHATNMSNIL